MKGMLVRLVLMLVMVVVLCTPTLGAAQDEEGDGRQLDVYVMTMSPGPVPWERFGHNALCIYDRSTGRNDAYNWGIFDFDNPLKFIGRFLIGDLVYSVDAFDAEGTAAEYLKGGRTVWVQQLDLLPQQKLALLQAAERATLPENKDYDYDYYQANCSTKVRDALDAQLGGQIEKQLAGIGDRGTYRWHTRRVSADAVYLYTTLTAVMGQPIDEPLTAWEESFLPERLRDHLRTVQVDRPDGTRVPLVKSERTLEPERSLGLVARAVPPDWTIPYLLVSLALGAVLALTSRPDRGRRGHVIFAVVAIVWCFVAGLCGAIGLWGWLATRHWVARYNENLLQFNPLLLGLLVLIPLLVRRRRPARTRAIKIVAIAVAACAVAGVVLKMLPAFDQVNREMLALGVPVNLALAWSVLRLARAKTPLAPVNEGARTG